MHLVGLDGFSDSEHFSWHVALFLSTGHTHTHACKRSNTHTLKIVQSTATRDVCVRLCVCVFRLVDSARDLSFLFARCSRVCFQRCCAFWCGAAFPKRVDTLMPCVSVCANHQRSLFRKWKNLRKQPTTRTRCPKDSRLKPGFRRDSNTGSQCRQTDGQTDGQTNEHANKQTNEHVSLLGDVLRSWCATGGFRSFVSMWFVTNMQDSWLTSRCSDSAHTQDGTDPR